MKLDQPVRIWLYLLLFAVGATKNFDLTLVARIPLSEIIAFGSLPFVVRGIPFARYAHRLRLVLCILGVWALGIMISDFANQFEIGRFARGFAKPIWCMLWLLFFIGVINKDFRALLWYPLGAVIAALQNYYFPQAWTIESVQGGGYEAVAYGIAPIILAVALWLAVLFYRKSRLLAVFLMLAASVVLAIVDAPRSMTAMYLLNALIILYVAWTRRAGAKIFRLTVPRLIGLSLLFLFGCFVVFELYKLAAYQGWLGEFQRGKLLSQSQTIFGDSILGLFIGGRTAVFGAVLAILDNPLIGYGSWSGIFLSEYYFDAVNYVGTNAAELSRLAAIGGAAPGHSIFFGSWMENGLLAALGLGGISFIVLREFVAIIQKDSRVAPLLIVFATAFFWSFLFSPFATQHRLIIGLFLAFYVINFHRIDAANYAHTRGIEDRHPARDTVARF